MTLDAMMTEASVLEEARRKAGLEDFGDEGPFREALSIILEDLRESPRLSGTTALLARGSIVHLLANRLRIAEALAKDPSIAERLLRRPLVVVGIPRTGTTFLHELLALDPDARPLLLYEAAWPVPDEGPDQERRLRHARLLVKFSRQVAADLSTAHRLGAEEPEECLGLLQNTFVTPFMLPFFEAGLRRYGEWLEGLGRGPRDRSYREYREQLQILQEDDRRRWVVKCPCHLFGLASLLRELPDAGVIQLHRDPVEAVPSMCSLQTMLGGMGSRRSDPVRTGASMMRMVDNLLRWGMEARRQEGEDRILDVRFRDLVGDPIGTVQTIYGRFGLPMSDAVRRRLEERLAANAREARTTHAYAPEEYGLTAGEIAGKFAWYYERFGLATPL